ncbi:MAG: hypothetical protein IT449_01430 [Phycisphaerales bacterium]|nr:hypothetical protein [Phycisphaerales bacterium]
MSTFGSEWHGFHRSRRRPGRARLARGAMVLSMLLSARLTDAQSTLRVSVSSMGEEGDGFSMFPWPSQDGRYIVFESDAGNLVPDDDNCTTDVFVHDCLTRTTERVSLAWDGGEANGASQRPRVSADGRYVVFQSGADNLVPHDTNGFMDIFVMDRWTLRVRRASEGAWGEEGNGASIHPKISADGRCVAFHTLANNWVGHDTNSQWDVYVRDLATGDIDLVSVRDDGVVGNDWSEHCALSGDGSLVVYHSKANNLVPDDHNGKDDAFLFDRQTRRVKRMSVGATGEESNGTSAFPSISDDGRYASFESEGANLAADDRNGKRDVFRFEVQTGALARVSKPAAGETDGDSMRSALSSDGRFVTFFSLAKNLAAADLNNTVDVFVWDAQDGRVVLGSLAANGAPSRGGSQFPILSGDGRIVAFHAFATDIVGEDHNLAADIFVRVLREAP